MRELEEGEQANRLATAAQGHHKLPGAAVLAGLGIAHHRASTVIDLCFLAGSSDDHHAGFGRLRAAPLETNCRTSARVRRPRTATCCSPFIHPT